MDNASKIKPVKMAAEERRKYILSMLEQYGSVTVSELSEHFGISEVSVRKLLISLEQDSLLQRTWGGAVRTARTTAGFRIKFGNQNICRKKWRLREPLMT